MEEKRNRVKISAKNVTATSIIPNNNRVNGMSDLRKDEGSK